MTAKRIFTLGMIVQSFWAWRSIRFYKANPFG